MSDTPDEYRDHIYFIHSAKGHVLVAGLGIGMVANMIARKPEVARITIVEVSEDVIALTGPALKAVHGDKIEIVHGSIFDYQPPKGTVYDALWFDIWDFICADNLPEMTKLHRKFARRKASSDTFVGSWARSQCLREQSHWRRSYWGQMKR